MVKHKDVETIDKPGKGPKKADVELDNGMFNLKQQHINMKVLLGYLN
jgi:hypothetical protein